MTHIVPLSVVFTPRQGTPKIHSIDTRIFSITYFQPCLSCNFCHDRCCSHGVDVDLPNIQRIIDHAAQLEKVVGIPSTDWFGPLLISDAEFPGGHYKRTQTRNGRCIFLDAVTRGCKLHRYCLDNEIDYHDLKPFYSTLFPLTIDAGVLHPSDDVDSLDLVCVGEGTSIYEGSKSELLYYYGAEFIEELDAIRRSPAQAKLSA